MSLIRTRPHIAFVQLDGLQIHTPPREPGGDPLIQRTNEVLATKYPILIHELRADDALVQFSKLSFGVTGASIKLAGTYDLDSGGLDFHGKLMLKAKPSQTTTGAKSFFLRAVDPFFKGKDAGTVLAIKVTGTKNNPSFGRDRGRASD